MTTVKFFGGLRRAAGGSTFTAEGGTVRAVLNGLCTDKPELRAALLDGDELRAQVRVVVNGRDIEFTGKLDTPLATDDQIAIFPPIAGGK